MAITLKRQISEEEKDQIIKQHGRICFATGHPIADDETVHYDHIKAYSQGNSSDLSNIAPMCEKHNKQKGTLSLHDFRTKILIDELFAPGNHLTLQDELKFLKEKGRIKNYGESVVIKNQTDDSIEIEFSNKPHRYSLHKCVITGWRYFYAPLPVDIINSDDDDDKETGLQPRYLIADKIFNLFRHFQNHPVLQPSLCRIRNDKVLTFDGQHKIAAMLWEGHKKFECKVYIDPDIRILNETNISAHDKYAQERFYSSILINKFGKQFSSEFKSYKNEEDGKPKTEEGFMQYLRNAHHYTTSDINRRFRSWLYDSVINDEKNKMAPYISKANRRADVAPITMDMLQKSILGFMYKEPVSDGITSSRYLRDDEINNMIHLCNFLVSESLYLWDATRGVNHPQQIRLKRIFGSKSMMAWAELLKDSITAKMELHDGDEKEKMFYRKIDENDLNKIKIIVRRLVGWKMWDSPPRSEIDTILGSNKTAIKDFIKEKNLTTGYLMGANE